MQASLSIRRLISYSKHPILLTTKRSLSTRTIQYPVLSSSSHSAHVAVVNRLPFSSHYARALNSTHSPSSVSSTLSHSSSSPSSTPCSSLSTALCATFGEHSACSVTTLQLSHSNNSHTARSIPQSYRLSTTNCDSKTNTTDRSPLQHHHNRNIRHQYHNSHSSNGSPTLFLSSSSSLNSQRRHFSSVANFRRQIEQFRQKMANSWKDLPTPNVVFVLGGPGSGKGTQCSLIAKEFGYVHLSAGDLLRKEQTTPGSEFGELIDGHIRNGTIVPVEITCSLLENAMLEHMITLREQALGGGQKIVDGGDAATEKVTNGGDNLTIPTGNFLIDGFPRNQNNLEGWKAQVADKINLKFVLFFECPKDVCVQRCLERGKNSGRADDNVESMNKRMDTYMNQTMPIINYYDQLGLVKRLNAEQQVADVFNDVKAIFSQ